MPHIISFHSIKSEIKATLSLSIPLITSQIIYACSGFIGTAMVAQLGEDALAASILISMIWMTLSVLFFGLLGSVSVLVSHQYGAKNNAAISDIMGQAYLLGMLIVILMVCILFTIPLFLHFTTQPIRVLTLAHEYMYSLIWTIPGLIMLVITEQFLAGINRNKFVLRISLLVVPIEIPLIYVLIFGKFGLPACGIAGIGYGFAMTYTGTAVFLLLYLLKSKKYQAFKIFNGMTKFHFNYMKALISVGLPMGFMHVLEVGAFAVTTFWIARFGTTMLAAYQIVFQYLIFATTLIFAMAQAVTVRVGHAVGRQDLLGIQYATYVGIALSFLSILFIAIAFYMTPYFFLKLDLDVNQISNAMLVKDAAMLLSISSASLIFDNLRLMGFGILRGLKDTHFPMYASFISFWLVGLSCAYLLGFHFHLQGKGILWGLTLGIASGAMILLTRVQYLLKHVDLAKIAKIG